MAIDLSFLRQLDRFNLVLKKRVNSQYQGEMETKELGEGLVFKDYREYTPGDDFRKIDWRVYGRTNKFYVKTMEEEKNLTIRVIIDASSSMNFGEPVSKFEYASMIGLGFGYMAMRSNEKFEVSTFSNKLNLIRARRGASQLMNVLDNLQRLKVEGSSKFRDSLEAYKKLIRTKSLVVIVSDFLYDLEEIERTLRLFRKSEVVVVQVLDKSEVTFDIGGDLILKDSESNFTLRTFVSRRMRQAYQERLRDHIYSLKNIAEDAGAKFHIATTDKEVFDVFYEILRKI